MPEWINVIFRTLAAVILLFAMMKLLGKRQISQLSLYEYITGITIGSLASYIPLETGDKWYLGMISLAVWVAIVLGIEFLQMRGKRIRDWLDGQQRILVQNGKLLDDNFRKERLTVDEFLAELRKQQIFKLADVEFAVMEPNGAINVLLKKENQPLTSKSMGIKVSNEQEPHLVIVDGTIRDKGLTMIGRNRGWLHAELEKQGVSLTNIFAAQVDAQGSLYIDLYDDQIELPKVQEKAQVLAVLKKCEADLELFALSTKDQNYKNMYQQSSKLLKQIINDSKPYLID
ncbi:Uncharacterized membrane protein YcaP, DUF421 family [Seinonella peptonophila]|uniref:Uncharacterized membrane protein YcaP, DUF421 family n=1 Tax=Seinonella peptonophila TaxID=112248 RepID=A0A1M4SS76_9BACL|nr:DUF421 domain-containing protein [Seinonella peptonophila]SHE35104.1 Uncharacterized membrane protein YcaP, DUF421 family [Seinonella peptonophila]